MTTPQDLSSMIGQEVGLSRWFEIDQARIDAFAQQGLDRFGDLGHAVKADDRQRPLHLVQMRTTKAKLGYIPATRTRETRLILLKRLIRTAQRKINLALDPRQRADVKICRSIHTEYCLRNLWGSFSPP